MFENKFPQQKSIIATKILYLLKYVKEVSRISPWLKGERIRRVDLEKSLKVIDLSRNERRIISNYIDDYAFLGGEMFWVAEDIPKLQRCLKSILHISDKEFDSILLSDSADLLRELVQTKTEGFVVSEIEEICNVLTKVEQL